MKTEDKLMPRRAQHDTDAECLRAQDIMRLVPSGFRTALDAGARDGYLTLRLIPLFERVTALDLLKPAIAGAECIQGDLTRMEFPDESFDFVLCTEVLEHVPQLERACREIVRVCRHSALIGVPYKQDIRIGRATCARCGNVSPPWGHLNTFTEEKLGRLLAPMRIVERSFVGSERARSNSVSVWLMDRAGNPWGTYGDDQYCLSCGAVLNGPRPRTFAQRCCSAVAVHLQKLQEMTSRPRPAWVHTLFQKI